MRLLTRPTGEAVAPLPRIAAQEIVPSLAGRSPTSALLAAALLAALLGSPRAVMADVEAGRTKAGQCATCHGPAGIGNMPNTPHLAGQPEGYLVDQLKAFRDGRRRNEVMNVVAKPLSDADIADLAAWYASQEIELKAQK